MCGGLEVDATADASTPMQFAPGVVQALDDIHRIHKIRVFPHENTSCTVLRPE
jgi:hypothetical protein